MTGEEWGFLAWCVMCCAFALHGLWSEFRPAPAPRPVHDNECVVSADGGMVLMDMRPRGPAAELTPAAARKLAGFLLATADEIDRRPESQDARPRNRDSDW